MGRAEYLGRGEFWTRGNSPTFMEYVYSNHYGYIILDIQYGYIDMSFWIFNMAVWIYTYGEEYGKIQSNHC